jgi:hypothetical protein
MFASPNPPAALTAAVIQGKETPMSGKHVGVPAGAPVRHHPVLVRVPVQHAGRTSDEGAGTLEPLDAERERPGKHAVVDIGEGDVGCPHRREADVASTPGRGPASGGGHLHLRGAGREGAGGRRCRPLKVAG